MKFLRLDNYENYKPAYSPIDKLDGEAIATELDQYVAWAHHSAALPGITAAGKDFLLYKNIRMFEETLTSYKPEYCLRNINGEIVKSKSNQGSLKLTDPLNTAYRTYLKNWFQKYQDEGYQGIWHDNGVEVQVFDPWFYDSHPVDPRTGELYDNDQFVVDCLDLANWLANEFPDMKHQANGFWNGHRYTQVQSGFDYVIANCELDGLFSEGMWGNIYGVLESGTKWKQSVDFLKVIQTDWLTKGKQFTIYSNAGGADTREQNSGVGIIGHEQSTLFMYASILLAVSEEGNIVSFHNAMSHQYTKDMMALPVGEPEGDYYPDGNGYMREWTGATIRVNPRTSVETVGGIELQPLSGHIELKEIQEQMSFEYENKETTPQKLEIGKDEVVVTFIPRETVTVEVDAKVVITLQDGERVRGVE